MNDHFKISFKIHNSEERRSTVNKNVVKCCVLSSMRNVTRSFCGSKKEDIESHRVFHCLQIYFHLYFRFYWQISAQNGQFELFICNIILCYYRLNTTKCHTIHLNNNTARGPGTRLCSVFILNIISQV